MSIILASALMVLQIGVHDVTPPNVRYQFVISQESKLPVAVCDEQFICHCPTGYQAVLGQASIAPEAMQVTCQPVATSSAQQRETFDSYQILPQPENFGK